MASSLVFIKLSASGTIKNGNEIEKKLYNIENFQMVRSFGSFFPEIKQNNMVAQDAIIILPAPEEMELNSESDQIINMGLLPKHVIIIKSNNIFVILFLFILFAFNDYRRLKR